MIEGVVVPDLAVCPAGDLLTLDLSPFCSGSVPSLTGSVLLAGFSVSLPFPSLSVETGVPIRVGVLLSSVSSITKAASKTAGSEVVTVPSADMSWLRLFEGRGLLDACVPAALEVRDNELEFRT